MRARVQLHPDLRVLSVKPAPLWSSLQLGPLQPAHSLPASRSLPAASTPFPTMPPPPLPSPLSQLSSSSPRKGKGTALRLWRLKAQCQFPLTHDWVTLDKSLVLRMKLTSQVGPRGYGRKGPANIWGCLLCAWGSLGVALPTSPLAASQMGWKGVHLEVGTWTMSPPFFFGGGQGCVLRHTGP